MYKTDFVNMFTVKVAELPDKTALKAQQVQITTVFLQRSSQSAFSAVNPGLS